MASLSWTFDWQAKRGPGGNAKDSLTTQREDSPFLSSKSTWGPARRALGVS